ncbi:MAG: hypothetical protein GYA34_03350 [Chloroflexi bacterium]|nr:hypothetical protein [Chloroflexota bacterium]
MQIQCNRWDWNRIRRLSRTSKAHKINGILLCLPIRRLITPIYGRVGYIGGNSNENGNGIALDIHSHAYITGYTSSTEAAFPIKEGPDLTYNGGPIDAFVAKIRSDGSDLEYCGYIGGEGGETGNGITVDASFNVYITSYTSSNETTFPVVKGPFFAHKGGGFDVFVAKISESVVADSFLYLPSIIR